MEMTAWISAVSIATAAIVSVANLIVMGRLTALIGRQSREMARYDVVRRNSEQWQALNLAMIASPRLQTLLDGHRLDTAEERQTYRNLLFYILNTLHDLHIAAQAGLVDEETAMTLLKGQSQALVLHAREVHGMLAGATGYQPAFRRFLEETLI
jgi:hypothetical protein